MSTSNRLPPGWAGPLEGKDPWPLRFYRHGFHAVCYNTQRCSIRYNQHQFGHATRAYDGSIVDRPSGPPPRPDWKDHLGGSYSVTPSDHGGRTFPGPVEINWASLDGAAHEAVLDLDALFKERLVLHRLSKDEIPEGWLAAKELNPLSPHILVEVNDRTINIYMRVRIPTKEPQVPDNPRSTAREDLMLAWTHTY